MEIVTGNTAEVSASADEHEEADGKIIAAGMVMSRFAKEGEDRIALEIKVQRNDTQQIVSIELDLELDDKTDKSGRTFCPFEGTCKTLKGLGYKYGDDLSQVDTLVGSDCHITNTPKWSNGKKYDNWKFSRQSNYLEANEAQRRFKELMEQFRAKRAGVAGVQTAPAQQRPAPFAAPTQAQPAAAPAAQPAAAPRGNPFNI
jgi:hypothetical protein